MRKKINGFFYISIKNEIYKKNQEKNLNKIKSQKIIQ